MVPRLPMRSEPVGSGGSQGLDVETRRLLNRRAPVSTGIFKSPIDIETRRAQNVAGRPDMGLSPEQEAANILRLYDEQTKPSPSGGGGSSERDIALQAIQTLRNRMNAPSQTDVLRTQLADIYKQAEDRIKAAGAELGSQLSTPLQVPEYSQAMNVAPAAMANYLSAIGASGADVSAQQGLSNALLQQIAGSAQQYAQGLTQADELVRRAMAGAVPANQLAGISQASLNRAALESRLAAQQTQERQSIEDQILQLALKYGIGL